MFNLKREVIIVCMIFFLLPAAYAGFAEYNSTFEAPYCGDLSGSFCTASSSLLQCAGDQVSPGPEPNYSNTIDSCEDASSVGSCHVDESVENVTITDLNGGIFREGDVLEVNYTVFCYGDVDRVALYYTNSTSDINWKRITLGNVTCSVEDSAESFVENITLEDVTGTQAIRVINKYDADIETPCDDEYYTDYDDVVFPVDSVIAPPTAPSVSLNDPVDNYDSSINYVLFDWTVVDDNDDSLLCNLTINGVVDAENVNSSNGTSTSVNVTGFLDGSYSWNVTCLNNNNLTNTSETRSFFIDVAAPDLTVSSPIDNYNYTSSLIDLNYIVSDSGIGIDSCWYTNTTGQNIDLPSCLNTTFNSPDGSQSITVYANDSLGNENSVEVNFVVDSTGPVINLESPLDTSTEDSTNLVVFSYNATDLLRDISSCTFYLNGVLNETDNSIAEGISQTFEKNLSNGNYNWSVSCLDDLDNSGSSQTFILTVDYTPVYEVTINLMSPADDSSSSNENVTFSYNVSSELTTSNCSLILNGFDNSTDYSILNDVEQTFESTLDNGNYNWSINCASENGQINSSSVWGLNVNYTPVYEPTINLISPANGSTSTSQDVTFSYNVTSIVDISSCNLTLDGVVDSMDDSITKNVAQTFVKTAMSNGIHNWSIACIDSENNVNSTENWAIIIDYAAPDDGGETSSSSSGGGGGGSNTIVTNLTEPEDEINDSDTDTVYLNISPVNKTKDLVVGESGNLLAGFATFIDRVGNLAEDNFFKLIVFAVFFVGLIVLYLWLVIKKPRKKKKKKRSPKRRKAKKLK
jgi:hypothetical protein